METPIPMNCRTCFQHNRKRLSRSPIDNTRPPLMTRFSIDFMFYSHISLRGHNSAFTIVDQGSMYPFAFPCCAKRPPISILTFFIKCLRNMGFHLAVFKMDEGGELCKSTEFCKELTEMGINVHSTGGDNKTSKWSRRTIPSDNSCNEQDHPGYIERFATITSTHRYQNPTFLGHLLGIYGTNKTDFN